MSQECMFIKDRVMAQLLNIMTLLQRLVFNFLTDSEVQKHLHF